MTGQDELAAEFETHRPYLRAIAFRMLGSHSDAEDAVQEAWLRLARGGHGEPPAREEPLARGGGADIRDLRGWLTTVTGRICLDVLRRRGTRGEEQLLELTIGPAEQRAAVGSGINPEDEVLLADSVGLAMYVVMDALTPAERVSFVLHEVFEVPFDAIAAILGRSTAATKMLASRARGRIRLGAPPPGNDVAAREVVTAFLTAAGQGDFDGLLAVLAPDAELRLEGRDGTLTVRGASRIASRATLGARQGGQGVPVLADGLPGVLIMMDGRPVSIMAFTVADGMVTVVRIVSDPDRLAQVVPSWVA